MVENCLTIYFVSSDKEKLDDYCSTINCELHIIEEMGGSGSDQGLFCLPFVSFAETNDSRNLFQNVVSYLDNSVSLITILNKYGFRLLLQFVQTASDFEEDCLGFTIYSDLLAHSVLLGAVIDVVIVFRPSFILNKNGKLTSGTYFYVYSDDSDLSNSKLNEVSGTKSTRFYKKGDIIHYLRTKQSAWCIELQHSNELPEKSIKVMLDYIKSPVRLGHYCKEHNLHSKMDLTYYGIISRRIEFTIGHPFLSLCHKLNVDFLDVDIMA